MVFSRISEEDNTTDLITLGKFKKTEHVCRTLFDSTLNTKFSKDRRKFFWKRGKAKEVQNHHEARKTKFTSFRAKQNK